MEIKKSDEEKLDEIAAKSNCIQIEHDVGLGSVFSDDGNMITIFRTGSYTLNIMLDENVASFEFHSARFIPFAKKHLSIVTLNIYLAPDECFCDDIKDRIDLCIALGDSIVKECLDQEQRVYFNERGAIISEGYLPDFINVNETDDSPF